MKLWITGFAVATLSWAQAVPVEKEPRHHLDFENEALAVLEPQIPAGDTTLEHLHSHDDVTICIHGSAVRAKSPGGEWSNPGASCMPGRVGVTEYTGNPRSHTVQNTGDGVYHLTLVENLRDSGWSTLPPVTAAGLKVARENRSFRIYEVDPSSTVAHSHAVPTVVIVVSGDVTTAGKHLDRAGQPVLIKAGEEHQISAKGDAKVFEIEVR